MTLTQPKPDTAMMSVMLPGPDRKRTYAPYHYWVTYRNPEPGEPGCVMTWEVGGGREPYQVSLEHTTRGDHAWHCTCADAVYRGDRDPHHACKHVRGLVELFPPVGRASAA